MSKAIELVKETRQEYEAWAAEKWGQSAYRHTSNCSGEWDAWQAGWLAGRHAARAESLREAAEFCDQQAKEPECPERAMYCAEGLRAMADREGK